MFIYVAALALMFICQNGVTAFIQTPSKAPRSAKAASWAASRPSQGDTRFASLAGVDDYGWEFGGGGEDDGSDDGGGSPDAATPSANLSDGESPDPAAQDARRARGDRDLLEGAWGREAVRHKYRGQTSEDLVCPEARALALRWGKAVGVAYPALALLAVCSIGPVGVT